MQHASVSLSVLNQLPAFIKENSPLFEDFVSQYYKSQERTGGPIDIVNNLSDYLNIGKYDLTKLDGHTTLIFDIDHETKNIEVENTYGFVERDGTILIDDEIIYYEYLKKSPSIILTSGISIGEFNTKKIELANPFNLFDSTRKRFELTSDNIPIFPPSSKHLIVKIYDEFLIPEVDYTVENDEIVFTQAPRTFDIINLSDTATSISIEYLKGFSQSNIQVMDTLVPSDENSPLKYIFNLKVNNVPFYPSATSLCVVIADGNYLMPSIDYSIYQNNIIFKVAPRESIYVAYINANLVSVGSGAESFSVVDDQGRIEKIIPRLGGSGYKIENTPQVTIVGGSGINATATALVGGITKLTLLDGGYGYSQTNPPSVVINPPTNPEGKQATAEVTVNTDGSIQSINLTSSGSGYDFVPRVQIVNPYGAEVGNPVVDGDSLESIEVISGGFGYTVAPHIYIDLPEDPNGIQAVAEGVLNDDGVLVAVNILAPGRGYSYLNPPRVKVVQPTGAQILDVEVDDFGRVINIELLDSGFGYNDVPSIYIVDERKDNLGNFIGGTGAKAVAAIFNGEIIDINITDFGSGYSRQFPPKVYISPTVGAKVSAEIGEDQITGFELINHGERYIKSEFVNCSRGVSGLLRYDINDVVFKKESESIPTVHKANALVTSIDSVFLKKIVDRICEQYLPGLPSLDTNTLNISNVLSTIKDFYASKGTVNSIKYLFKLLYGESVSVTYPKDQIIKPSSSTWSVDTVLRAKLISGDPNNIKDSLMEQFDDPIDINVSYASALVENYTAIQTAFYDVYELILSEESIVGKFVIPYSTKLIERVDPEDLIINVDSTIGWPDRNGEVIIGSEIIRYKEKTLTQFIECTRGLYGTEPTKWDAGTEVVSNVYVYLNKGTSEEVILSILGIIDANKTILIDDGNYYLEGDKLSISKLGTDDTSELVTSWLYNVKKLLKVENMTFGGLNNRTVSVVTDTPHGLLVGDKFTVYGANPIVYNGSFLVTARESDTVFKYEIPQPAVADPQGNILISIDLNTGKSDNNTINNTISKYPSNIQNTFLNDTHVYVAASGIPNYKIGPFPGTALLPGNQRKLYKFPRIPNTISLKTIIKPGPIGSFVNGISIWSYKSTNTLPYGPVTSVKITNPGKDYDASVPPILTISGGGGQNASAEVVVDGSVIGFEVLNGGSGYTDAPLVSIYGSDGIGAAGTAVVTNGRLTNILLNTPGSGYTSEPIVTITGGGGVGAEARAIVRGPIKEVVVTNPGTSYTSPPKVSISSGQGAAAQAYVSNGRIISIAIIAAGTGYTTAPKVVITGDGYGAVARAIISTEGVDSGRVISIEIVNRGIGYVQGTTQIRLESVGELAEFESEIFEWTFNLNQTTTFDYANGSIFEGFNNQFGGEYAHISNPKQLRYVLGDNIDIVNGELVERESVLHSPILGWAFDGNPIYGPYGLSDPTNLSSSIVPIQSSYVLKTNLVFDQNTNPVPSRIEGPDLSEYPAGSFIEDYEYTFNSLSVYLDEYNGRFTKTPEYPNGTYAYFVTIDAAGQSKFPYVLGPEFNSSPELWNLNQFATQSNIPTGVVRYRTPFENVDIDVERQPNESTNALTLENGDFLTFDIEDENKDGIIDESEIDDPDVIFEEDRLEVFDYFPKINISSKVDIEVNTTTKFEDAKISGFLIENEGDDYQVGDRLVFDNEGTDGYGASARISSIKGKQITSYTYEYDNQEDVFKGRVATSEPHNLIVGDIVTLNTVPEMEPTSKTILVKSIRGIERVEVTQVGTGYLSDEIPTVNIESPTGEYGKITPIVSSNGVIENFDIINSGDGYLTDPIVRVSHPQTKKKADYYYTSHNTTNGEVTILNGIVSDDKTAIVVGKVKLPDGNYHGFLQKLSSDGTVVWTKSLSSTQPGTPNNYCELVSVKKKDNKIYVVGITKPNGNLNSVFNPDIIIARYTENTTGSTVSLSWQREFAGISGITRADYATDVACLNDNIIVTGYTNTNTTSVNDGILLYMNSSGDLITKRKLTSLSLEEKIHSINVDSTGNIFIVGNSNVNNILVSKLYLSSNRLLVEWTKEFSITNYSFNDVSSVIDENDQLYITSAVKNTITNVKNIVQFFRLANDGSIVKNRFNTIAPAVDISCGKCSIDIFGDVNVSYTIDNNQDGTKQVGVFKFRYDGKVLKSTKISSLVKGFETSVCISDVSGDPIILGTVYDNRTQFLFNAENAYEDITERSLDLTSSGTVNISVDTKYGTGSYEVTQSAKLTAGSLTNTSNDWTIEKWIKWDNTATAKVPVLIRATDGVNGVRVVVFADTASPSTYGKIRLSNDGATVSQFSSASTHITDLTTDWVHLKVTKEYNSGVSTYKLYWNGTLSATISENVNVSPSTIEFGSTTAYQSWPMKIDDIRYSSYPTIGVPTEGHLKADYGNPSGLSFKTDKNADADRLGTINLTTNDIAITRSLYTPNAAEQDVIISSSTYTLAPEGLQILDFNNAISGLAQDYAIPTVRLDKWSVRTATIPTVGGSKVKVRAKTFDKFFFKHFQTEKTDNVLRLTLNQGFDFNVGTTLYQRNNLGAIIATARIIDKDLENNDLIVGDTTGSFVETTGYLQSSDNFVNEIQGYVFAEVNNTTPGTFDIEIPNEIFGIFKDYSDNDYLIRIDEVLQGSSYVVGSIVTISSNDISFTSNRKEATITNLTAVTKISIITNLTKVLQINTKNNTNLMFVRTATSHYLKTRDIVYCQVSPVNYEPLNGTFDVYDVISKKEFILELRDVPVSNITSAQTVSIYVKTPVFRFIYGQQYTFDTSDPSMQGHYLSFYRDNLYKIEYTFKNIVRRGTPGFDQPGASPYISFKITDDVSNITYYADPSNLTDDGPVTNDSYLDIQLSPYIGKFAVTDLDGGSITQGPNVFKFNLAYEPEKNATTASSSYSTESLKDSGPISSIKLISGGGFYKKLPVVSGIESSRKIERVNIIEPGSEYAAGQYFGVPILGDGNGGKVSILVDGTTDPAGQIVEVTITDPGKGYTQAYIDVDAVDGILGPLLSGSGAVLQVEIPPFGSGASIFTKGTQVGKIKNLKNNNYGFNYTHDYTLRPEITFPLNLQLTSTSVISGIKITNPGTGYTTAPEVVIEGGGGSGATAVAEIRNGRLSSIIVKEPGSGYSTAPTISLKSAFTYVVNIDLGLFQFSFPHGIVSGSEITFTNQDVGEGTQFPLTSFGYINPNQTYYAITGLENGLEDEQLRVALTPQDAISGNYIAFVNAGTGRQIILTDSFGGAAESIVEVGRFLSGELIYQGETYENATATAYVSTNDGWQIGPRLLKIVNIDGVFTVGQPVTGLISKSSGIIDSISNAKGVLEVDSTTTTAGKFTSDVGKLGEIVQKIQDSYLYQNFSYNIKSPVPIELWRETLIENVHPAGFKVFGEIDLVEDKKGITNKTDFELTKSVNLIESSVVSTIQDYAIVEPVYSDFDNTQVLFRNKKLTTSEEILTSVVQRLDDISNLFDGERTAFPLTILGEPVIADSSQFLITINGVIQPPGSSFVVQQGNIIFTEPPSAPTKISYAKLTLQFVPTQILNISNLSGILPEFGGSIRGITTNTTANIVQSTSGSLRVYNITGDGFENGEVIISTATGMNAILVSQETFNVDNIYQFEEVITNTTKDTAVVEEINLNTTNNIVTNEITISKTSGTYLNPSGVLDLDIGDYILSARTGVFARITSLSPYLDPSTEQPISSISISDPSTFTGLLFSREIIPDRPNTILDDIGNSVVEVVNVEDDEQKYEINFVPFEDITNIVLDFNYNTGTTVITNDLLQSLYVNYINESDDFTSGETIVSKRLTYHTLSGGNFFQGDIITGSDSGETAEIIGINYALKTLFLGNQSGDFNLGETITSGSVSAVTSQYLTVPFTVNQIQTSNKKIITGQIDLDNRHRFRDAANLIRLNAAHIVEEAAGRMKSRYPDLLIPGDEGGNTEGTNRCKLDLSLLLDAVAEDIEVGGNYNTTTAARFYLDSNGGLRFIKLQILQSLYAHTQMSELCQDAVIGNLSDTPLYSDILPVPPYDVIVDPGDCADVRSAIDSLWTLINTILSPVDQAYIDAANQLWFNRNFIAQEATGYIENYFTYQLNGVNYTALTYPNGNSSKCERDITDYIIPSIIADMLTGGNDNIITAMEFYIGNAEIEYVKDELLQTVIAFEKVNELCQYAVDNWIISGTTSSEYATIYNTTAPKYKDLTIPADDGTYGGNCERIKATIDTLFNIGIGILIPERNSFFGRYYDASNLIESNKQLIAEVAVGRMLNAYPAFTIPNGNQNCIDDIVDILDAIIYDLRNGGNARTFDYSQVYTINSYLSGEQIQSNYAFNQARDMAIQAMRNQSITIGGYSSLTQVIDNTIEVDPSNPTCANVASSITTLFSILTTAVTNGNMNHVTRQSESNANKLYRDAAKLLLFNKEYIKYESLQRTLNQYPSFSIPGGNAKCLRDMGYIIDAIVYDLLTNGNSGILNATLSYIDATTGTIVSLEGELVQSIYAYNRVLDYMKLAVAETLTSPATASGQYAYTDPNISITGSDLTEIQNFITDNMSILLGTLNNSSYIEINQIIGVNSLSVPEKSYPSREPFTPIKGSLSVGDYIYGSTSGEFAEVESIINNRGYVKNILHRLEIQYNDPDEVFSHNTSVTRQGFPGTTGTIVSTENGEFVSYIDVSMTSGQFSVGHTLIDDNGYLATITSITNRVQLINVVGSFGSNEYISGLYSGAELTSNNFDYNVCPILSNTGSKLTLETEALQGEFLPSRLVYSNNTSYYIDVVDPQGTLVGINDIVRTTRTVRLTVNINAQVGSDFPIGSTLFKVNGLIPTTSSAKILNVELINNDTEAYIYVANFTESDFIVGDVVSYFEDGEVFPSGSGTISNVLITATESYATITKISQIGLGYRLYLGNVVGNLSPYSQVISSYNYRAAITNVVEVAGRVSRSFVGFNGIQDTFALTENNGDPYFPPEDGHLLLFLNGVLQPPGSSYTIFGDTVQFSEPPTIGSLFSAVYLGKLRQLDDIGFQFDSLRSTFNLKLNDSFYSLTLTDGVQSSTIRPENNIIISLNGVIQEPGVAFELVGSRVIFAEVPRAGSTFVAFSYIGSDTDVISVDVIPPVEIGDKLSIEGELEDRTVAVIESSNSLITFDYLGSILGNGAEALTEIIRGRIKNIQLTSGGEGYTSEPSISFNSLTGFDAQARAQVGVSRVVVNNRGSGYAYPTVDIVYDVPPPPEGFEFRFDDNEASWDTNAVTFDQV